MKKFLLLMFACFMYVGLQAKIIQVNNNVGASADHTLLQQAIDAAASGDTIYINGSPNVYDGNTLLRLNKTLILIGPGYFLGENGQTQSTNQTAKINGLEIGEGASNSVLVGLDFKTSGYITFSKDKRDGNVGTSAANNVIIRRNLISYISLNYSSGTIIEQNYFSYSNVTLGIDNGASNTLIQNNIMNSGSSSSIDGPYYDELSNTIIRNNTFTNGLYTVHGTQINNNIFFSGILSNCDNNTLKNNIFVSAEAVIIPTGSTGNTTQNNKFSVTAGDLFVKATPAVDNEFKLKASSPAAGAGIDGIDAGAFGGLNAYKLSGLPPIPSIYEVTTTGIGTKENGLKVVIKAKSNN